MSKKVSSYTISKFYCTECGQEGIPIPRPNKKRRTDGHIKDLYCVHCKKITQHKEALDK